MKLLASALIAFVVSILLLVVVRPLAVRLGFVDRPGGRKNHDGIVPVYGGLSKFSGVMVASWAYGPFGAHGHVLLFASAFVVLLGLFDDRLDIPPRLRFIAQGCAAAALMYGTRFTLPDLGHLFGTAHGPVPLDVLSLPFTLLACVALINAFNMLDGLDGLAAGVALAAFLGVAGMGLLRPAPVSLLIACCMVGALAAFLLFNMPERFNRAVRVFMGDAGSTLLGFVLAGVGLTLVQTDRADVPPVLVLWLMPLPIFELFDSTWRRLRAGHSITAADAGHFHHRLTRAGYSVRKVFYLYLALSGAGAGIAVLALQWGAPEPLMAVAFVGAFVGWIAFVRRAVVVGAAAGGTTR
ncbi:MAG: hypothetical protein RLZZ393_716 [Pseudomonadota bacterium]